MGFPGRAPHVELRQTGLARRHVREPSQPDETVRVTQIPELADDPHAGGFLGFDEFAIEQLDERITRSRVERVLPQVDDRTAELSGGRGFDESTAIGYRHARSSLR